VTEPLIVYSRRVLLPGGLRPAGIRVRQGQIEAVLDHPTANAVDLGDLILAPSLVDTHVHVNEPGRTEWEGFRSATRAAARGGIGRIVDMPLNSDPVTTTLDALHTKLASTPGKLWVDCSFWGGVVPGNRDQLAPMTQAGVMGFKAFLCHSGIDDFPASDDQTLRHAMPILRDAGVPLLVHAELETDIVNALRDRSPREYLRYLHSRPKEWEDNAIAMMIELARQTGCHTHIVHLSSATALPMIRTAKAQGVPLTVETCPHYLCLSAEEVPDGATEYKCAPPIRETENQRALWAGLADGTIDFVISDHSPCIPQLKLPERGDFMEAWGGIASLQLGLPAVWTEARRRGHTVADLHRWLGAGPRGLLGLTASIEVGQPADLVAWDPEQPWTVDPDDLEHRHPVTPYRGRALTGSVHSLWLRGHRVVDLGRITGEAQGRTVLGRGA